MPKAAVEESEIPHAFFTHMGLPEGVGNFNLRVLGIGTRAGGQTVRDFAFHLETGLTRNIGLHIRNDRFTTNSKTEAMLQFAAFVSKNGMNGFAPIIEFEVPTRPGASRVNSLVGFTSSLGGSRWVVNQALHYNPRDDMGDASASLVVKAGRSVFPVVEILSNAGKGQLGFTNVLAGLKVRVAKQFTLGLAYQLPLSTRRDFSSQLPFGPDISWRW